jgi:hypothetical protein
VTLSYQPAGTSPDKIHTPYQLPVDTKKVKQFTDDLFPHLISMKRVAKQQL